MPQFQAGDEILVQFVGHALFHARLILAWVFNEMYIICSPDADVYLEDYNDANDVAQVVVRGPGRAVPYGMGAAQLHDFNPPPSAAQVAMLLVAGQREADSERANLGLPPFHGGVAGGAGGGPPAADEARDPVHDRAGRGGWWSVGLDSSLRSSSPHATLGVLAQWV